MNKPRYASHLSFRRCSKLIRHRSCTGLHLAENPTAVSRYHFILWVLCAVLTANPCLASPNQAPFSRHLYVGALGGYGATTWGGLVPSEENLNEAMSMSTPITVEEGGGVWGVLAGYEILPFFAIEFSYMKYPNATINFDPESIFSFMNNELTSFGSKTDTLNLMGKVMFFIPNTTVRAYSSAGLASVHRSDLLLDERRISPSFGVGLNYHLTENFMGELGGNYTAGYGESQLNPTNTYFPFLYSFSLRLAYFLA